MDSWPVVTGTNTGAHHVTVFPLSLVFRLRGRGRPATVIQTMRMRSLLSKWILYFPSTMYIRGNETKRKSIFNIQQQCGCEKP